MKILSFILAQIFLLGSLCFADSITIAADEWPPFNNTPGSEKEGYMIDIAREIFESRGHQFSYIIIPWKRAVRESLQGKYTGVVGASKTDARGFIFPSEELARNYLTFYVKKGNPWRFKGQSSLLDVRLAVVAGYDYRQWLNAYIQNHLDEHGKIYTNFGLNPLESNLQLLVAKRVDVVVDSEASIRFLAGKINLLAEIERAGYGHLPSYCYIAFSPRIPKSTSYARQLSDGISAMRKSGRLQEILDRYGMTDWQARDHQ